MCGRGTQDLSWREIVELLRIIPGTPAPNLRPNWNVAPTQDIYVCSEAGGERRLETMRWGLVPIWAKELPKFATFNARAETLEDKATWKGSLGKMRAVIPFSGFYEWKGQKGEKQPYYITRRDGAPVLLAGLWAFNNKIEGEIRSATVIVCDPNKAMAKLHNRMPVILSPESVDDWLTGAWGDDKRDLLRPCPDDWLTAVPVAKDVGNVKNNRPELVTPTGDALF